MELLNYSWERGLWDKSKELQGKAMSRLIFSKILEMVKWCWIVSHFVRWNIFIFHIFVFLSFWQWIWENILMSFWLIWPFTLTFLRVIFFWRFFRFTFSQPPTLIQESRSWNKGKLEALIVEQCLWYPKQRLRREESIPTDAPCVPPRSQQLVILNSMCLFTPEKSRSAAISVSTNAQGKVT